jgi:arginase family enzyme
VDAVGGLVPEVTGLYVHIDLDVLDAAVADVNVYGAPGGPDADQLDALVAALLEAFPVRAVSLTAYDPAFDGTDRVPPIALRLLRTIAQRV